MGSDMYDEEDRAGLMAGRQRRGGRHIAPWLCAGLLLMAGYGARSTWSSNESRVGDEFISEEQQFSASKLRYHFIIGVDYSLLNDDPKKKAFRKSIRGAIELKAKLKQCADATPEDDCPVRVLKKVETTAAQQSPARAEVTVEIDVPRQLAVDALIK